MEIGKIWQIIKINTGLRLKNLIQINSKRKFCEKRFWSNYAVITKNYQNKYENMKTQARFFVKLGTNQN